MRVRLALFSIITLGLSLLIILFSHSNLIRPEVVILSTPTPAPLNFAIFADIHEDLVSLKKALTTVKKDDVEFIIILGDLTNLGNKSELETVKKTLDASRLKYYVVPGNHDLWFGRRTKQPLFHQVFGADFGSFEKSGYKFILINNGDDYLGVSSITGIDGTNQMDWLKAELQECLSIDCLVFLHEPLNHPYSGHIMGENSPSVASEATKLVNLFKEFRVREIFAGHLHLMDEYQIEGLKTTLVGSLCKERNYQDPNFLKISGFDQRENIILSSN